MPVQTAITAVDVLVVIVEMHKSSYGSSAGDLDSFLTACDEFLSEEDRRKLRKRLAAMDLLQEVVQHEP